MHGEIISQNDCEMQGKILPVAHGGAEGRGAEWIFPWWWISWIWGGVKYICGVQVLDWIALMGSEKHSPWFVILTMKSEKWKL